MRKKAIITEATRQKNRDRANALKASRKASGLCSSCGKMSPVQAKVNCQDCIDKHNKHWHEQSTKDKLAAFNAYGGPLCACCGENIVEFLTVDHIDGNGSEHRRQEDFTNIYAWLRQNNYPSGFQVLCSNCQNRWKCPGKICPHKSLLLPPARATVVTTNVY